MTTNELALIIDDQVATADKRPTMIRDDLSHVRFNPDFATVIKGIRRCGKSTLTHQYRQKGKGRSLSLNFDDLRMMTFSTGDFRILDALIDKRKPTLLIFDEIHDVDGWELYVRQKLDQGYKVLVTGSNATLLSRELGTKLTGRHIDIETQPFSYAEFLRFTKAKPGVPSLEKYIVRGGFPGYLKTGDADVLRELVGDIIYKDIAVRHNIKDTRPLRNLCSFLLGNAANRINPSRLKEAMHVKSATTMLEYFSYFEDAYLISRLECYSPSTKARLLAPKKVYIADTALPSALNASQTPDRGAMLENLVYHVLRKNSAEIYYHDSGSTECDFVVKDARGHWGGVQVCWELTAENQGREFSGLVAALDAFGLKEGTIVTASSKDLAVHDGHVLHVIPASEFLLNSSNEITR